MSRHALLFLALVALGACSADDPPAVPDGEAVVPSEAAKRTDPAEIPEPELSREVALSQADERVARGDFAGAIEALASLAEASPQDAEVGERLLAARRAWLHSKRNAFVHATDLEATFRTRHGGDLPIGPLHEQAFLAYRLAAQAHEVRASRDALDFLSGPAHILRELARADASEFRERGYGTVLGAISNLAALAHLDLGETTLAEEAFSVARQYDPADPMARANQEILRESGLVEPGD